jgi:hypothetical protein
MKLQAFGVSDPEALQSQIRPYAQNRVSINALAVVHRRLREAFNMLQGLNKPPV